MGDVTRMLGQPQQGDHKAAEELLPQVYAELRRLAAYRLAHETPGQTLQATALVHEAYLRLAQAGCTHWEDSRHVFNAIAEAMRHVLIDNARRKKSGKHGGGWERSGMDDVEIPEVATPDELLAVDEALERLAKVHPEEAELVKLRYFVGMTQDEAARVLGVSRGTVNNRWNFARAWLYQALHDGG